MLDEIFRNPFVEAFGRALRNVIREKEIEVTTESGEKKKIPGAQDYASLVELEWAEKEEEFADRLKKFLRRYHAYVRRCEREYHWLPFIPTEEDLDGIVKLAQEYGVKTVRAALIGHALVKPKKGGE